MQKQRARLLEIISEKDREIEITKNSLATLYSQHYAGDPVDPPQDATSKSPVSRKSSRKLRRSTESIRSALTYRSEVPDDDDESPSRPGPVPRSFSTHMSDSKNIFYEQEISRKEQEISELRFSHSNILFLNNILFLGILFDYPKRKSAKLSKLHL